MSTKKKAVVILGLVLGLICCFLIGQIFILPIRNSNIDTDENKGYDLISHYDEASLEGEATKEDNPWKTSVGKIETDEYGTVIFLTPETSIIFNCPDNIGSNLKFDYRIHPWVDKTQSDGTNLEVNISISDNNKVVLSKEFRVTPEEEMTSAALDLKEFSGKAIKIKFSCEDNSNQNSDWVILNKIEIY